MSLATAIKGYKKDTLPALIEIDKHFKKFKLPSQLPEVIKNAAMAVNPNGKMNNHQRRNGKEACEEGAMALAKYEVEIKSAKSFEEVFVITEQIANGIDRLGPLWSYDTALRIGFAKDVYPSEIYVQSGVKKGVRKVMNGKLPRGRSLPKHMFPAPLQQLKPYQLENFLCIYGKDYKSAKRK
jgi:hypothetical protein